jgi:hypothetical protein
MYSKNVFCKIVLIFPGGGKGKVSRENLIYNNGLIMKFLIIKSHIFYLRRIKAQAEKKLLP